MSAEVVSPLDVHLGSMSQAGQLQTLVDQQERVNEAERVAEQLRFTIREAREACGHFQEMAGSDAKLASALTFIEAILSEVE